MLGILIFGRNYKKRIATLEGKVNNLSQPSTENTSPRGEGRVQLGTCPVVQSHTDDLLPRKTPKELVGVISGLTSIQADPIIQPHIGSRLTMRAKVIDVDDKDDCIQVYAETEDEVSVYFEFNKRSWKGDLKVLNRGDEFEATGSLSSVEEYGITLERCKLLV